MKSLIQDTRGFSIVEILMSAGILSIVGLGFASMFIHQARTLEHLRLKADGLDTQASVRMAMDNDLFCKCQFAGVHFDPAAIPGSIAVAGDLQAYDNVCNIKGTLLSATPDPGMLGLSDMKLSNIQEVTANTLYYADFTINFRADHSVPPKSIVYTGLLLNTTISSGEAYVANCGEPAESTELNCPAGFVVVGQASSTGAFCVSDNSLAATTFFSAMNTCRTTASADGAEAHLCTAWEWYNACQSAVATAMGSQWEWVADMKDASFAFTYGNTGCSDHQSPGTGDSYRYRCCIRR